MKQITKMILATTILFLSNGLIAQESNTVSKKVDEKNHTEMTVEERAQKRTEKMKEELALDASQETKIYAINLAHITEMEKLRAEQKVLKEKMKAERESAKSKIKAVLTPEQNVIFDQKCEEHKKKQQERKAENQD